MVQPEISLGSGAGRGDQIGGLTQVLAVADQLERAQWLGRGELGLRQGLGGAARDRR